MTDQLHGDLLTLRYVALDDALAWLWGANPKRHDGDGLRASIRRYGFRDPSIYDGSLPGIAAGNGRLQALDTLRQAGEMTGRLVYGLERVPEFVAVILERLAGMDLEPRLVAGEQVGA